MPYSGRAVNTSLPPMTAVRSCIDRTELRNTAHRALSLVVVISALAFSSQSSLASPGFKDPLDNSARIVDRLDKRPMQAVARAGDRLVAVGSRGLIMVSDRRW